MNAVADRMPPTLTREELVDITGYKRGKDQFDYLVLHGWNVSWNERSHRPIVHRLWYEAFVTNQQAVNSTAKPRFELVKNGRKKNEKH